MEKQECDQYIDVSFGENVNYLPLRRWDGNEYCEEFFAYAGEPMFKAVSDVAFGKTDGPTTTRLYVPHAKETKLQEAYLTDCKIIPDDLRIDEENRVCALFCLCDKGNQIKGVYDTSEGAFKREVGAKELLNIPRWYRDKERFDTLVSWYDTGELSIPDFHRKYVWDKLKASRLIEAILLGLPMQNIVLSYSDSPGRKRLVVDGYQRIVTVYNYIYGNKFKLLNSKKIDYRWRGKKFSDLSFEERRKIEDAEVPVTILNSSAPEEEEAILLQLFERYNTCAAVKAQRKT